MRTEKIIITGHSAHDVASHKLFFTPFSYSKRFIFMIGKLLIFEIVDCHTHKHAHTRSHTHKHAHTRSHTLIHAYKFTRKKLFLLVTGVFVFALVCIFILFFRRSTHDFNQWKLIGNWLNGKTHKSFDLILTSVKWFDNW